MKAVGRRKLLLAVFIPLCSPSHFLLKLIYPMGIDQTSEDMVFPFAIND